MTEQKVVERIIYKSLPVISCSTLVFPISQGDKLYMAVCFWYIKVTCLVAYTEESRFTRYQKHTAMFNRSPCTLYKARKRHC